MDIDGFLLHEEDPVYHHFKNHEIDPFVVEQNRYTTIMINTIQSLKATTKSLTTKFLSYYRLDGQCNNPKSPLIGSINTPFIRLLEDGFDDGYEVVSKIRTVESPRSDSHVANTARGLNENLSPETSSDMATMAFQILTHEMMLTLKTQLTPEPIEGGFDCCNPTGNPLLASLIKMNKYCLPITIPSNDQCYAGKTKCLNYIRAFRAFDQWNLQTAPTQVNFHTPYIDLELIYNKKSLEHLLVNNGLFDLANDTKMHDILVGYDVRSMQLPGLFLYLSYYIRLHNEIFKEFTRLRPAVPMNTNLFETRKIVTAVFQKISIDLVVSVMDFTIPSTKCYNPKVNAQVSLEFNIAFRVLHYFIRDKMGLYDRKNFLVNEGIRGKMPTLTDQSILIDNLTEYTSNKCGLMHGLVDTSWNLGGMGDVVHCKFFSKNSSQVGTDLRSMDFQFGREVGEPSYLSFLRYAKQITKCDGDVNATDLSNSFDSGTLNFLMKRYQNKIYEMGLSIGFDFEARNGAILEPGVQAIITDQLQRTICGDRFWYNHDNGLFTQSQRDRINTIDMNQLLCINHGCNGTRIQFFPFLSAGRSNRKAICPTTADIIGILDLKTW
ncbi:peroxidase-like [Chironomus tepperi]|uniref:peroxidase-like n=1 Tax=Chironomus tepperi TaxID=113505 RepID=UPI00391FC849